MDGINTVRDLEARFGVETGDLIMCTIDEHHGQNLSIVVGLYHPYDGLSGDHGLRPGVVDLKHGAQQRKGLLKSAEYFRIHLSGNCCGDRTQILASQYQNQIKISELVSFQIVKKTSEVTEFFVNS